MSELVTEIDIVLYGPLYLHFNRSFLQLQHNFMAVAHATSHCSLIHRLNFI